MRCGPLILLSLALFASAGQADTLQLKPVADTSIFAAKATSNFGKEGSVPLGTINNSTDPGRLLLRFDLSSLPAGAIVTNVTLRIAVVKQHSGSAKELIGAHRLLRAWGEGAKSGQLGAAATSGEADWLSPLVGQEIWGAPGGQPGTDFVAESSSTANLGGPANYTFASTDALVSDVRAWLQDPASNFGWLLASQQEQVLGSAKRVAARENAAQAPLLTVQFAVPPPGPRFGSVALNGDSVALGFKALSGNIYTVSFRDALETGAWQPLTNVIAKLQDLDAVVFDPVAGSMRFYQVEITGQVD